jgi:hypothetical protein
LWGNLKGKVYRNTPRTAEALQNEIRNVVASISALVNTVMKEPSTGPYPEPDKSNAYHPIVSL